MNNMIDSKRAAGLLFFILIALQMFGCSADTRPEHFKLSGFTMGTSYHITVLANDQVTISPDELQLAIEQQLQLINQQMSTYLPDSEISRFNSAPVNKWVNVSSNLFDVLVMSLELGWLTNGAFDISIGPLVKLWGFGPGASDNPHVEDKTVPAAETIAELLNITGFQNLELNLADGDIRKTQPISIDLSGIAKGLAVDKVTALLNYAGYSDFMVEVGGELRLQGNSIRGTPWRIAIEQPEVSAFGLVHSAVSVSGVGMATSGDYRNYFEHGGKRYSHTIDPTTGYPIEHKLASVTVIADTAAYADGLATAINVMGPELGMRFAEQHNFAIYMIIKTDDGFAARYSRAFKPYLN